MQQSIRVLFVCLGNICRSPAAEGVFRSRLERDGLARWVTVDSAGTHGYHTGRPPDERACGAAHARGIDLDGLRARPLDEGDFYLFDYLLVMDEQNLADARHVRPPDAPVVPRLLLEFAHRSPLREVPDPYWGGQDGFEHMLDLIEDAVDGLLAEIRHTLAERGISLES